MSLSEEQKIDPSILDEDNPAGLDPREAVNGGMNLKNKPRGIIKINKKGMLVGGVLLGAALIVASLTFNGTGAAISGAAQDAVAGQSKPSGRPQEINRDVMWYANVPDKVSSPEADQAANAAKGKSDTAANAQGNDQSQNAPSNTALEVPDLTGQGVSPLEAATAGRTSAPNLGKSGSANGAQLSQADQQRQQQALQREQHKQQELDQAMKAGLSAQGFGGTTQAATNGVTAPTTNGLGNGFMGAQNGLQAPQSPQEDPNKQDRKDQFLKSAKSTVDPDYSPSQKTAPRSPYEVKAGAIIPAVMIGGINSDLPGQVIAQVRENVYDTKTGEFLLIPQGSRLVGLYDAHVAYGQKRILLAWNRVIYPDGSSFDLKGMPGADKAGYAGFFDQVDNHYRKIFGSAVLMSMISAGVQLSQPNNGSSGNNNNTPSVSQTVGAALGQQIGQTAMTITQKNLNIQPTLEVRPGYQFNVMVTADMILPPPQ